MIFMKEKLIFKKKYLYIALHKNLFFIFCFYSDFNFKKLLLKSILLHFLKSQTNIISRLKKQYANFLNRGFFVHDFSVI